MHVLPVASWTYHRGRTAGALAIAASLLTLMAGERTFGAGYFVAADWQATVSLAVSLGFTCALVGGFALYARKDAGHRCRPASAVGRGADPDTVARELLHLTA